MAKGDGYFNTEELNKLLTKLRRKLNPLKIKTKVEHSGHRIDLDFSRDWQEDGGEVNCSLNLTIPPFEKSSINISFYGMHKEEHFCIFNSIFGYAKEVAAHFNIKTIIADDYNSANSAKFGFVCAKDFPGEDYPVSLLGSNKRSDDCMDRNVHEAVYYLELEPGYIQRRIQLADEFIKATKLIESKDITFKNKGNYVSGDYSGFEFYYDGFNGRITLFFNEMKITLEEGERMTDCKLVKEWQIEDKSDIERLVTLVVETAVESVGLKRLLTPPRKHFHDYVYKNFYNLNPFIDRIFESLLSEYDAKEIEVKILSEPERKYFSYEGIYIFGVLEKYFVITFNPANLLMFDTKEESFQRFDDMCSDREKTVYLEKLAKIQTVKEKAIADIL